jgi:hypothetical protein
MGVESFPFMKILYLDIIIGLIDFLLITRLAFKDIVTKERICRDLVSFLLY